MNGDDLAWTQLKITTVWMNATLTLNDGHAHHDCGCIYQIHIRLFVLMIVAGYAVCVFFGF